MKSVKAEPKTMVKRPSKRRKKDDEPEVVKATPSTIDELHKGNVWSLSEQELYELYQAGRKDENFSEKERHYMNIIRPAFSFVLFNHNDKAMHDKLMGEGYMIFPLSVSSKNNTVAIRKRSVRTVMDLNMENIYVIEPAELLKLIDNNLGKGWKGLPLPIQDIIQQGFYIDCTEMPKDMIDFIMQKRVEDGYEVLQIERGMWVELVSVKVKPKTEKRHFEVLVDGKPARRRRGHHSDDEDELDDEAELDDEDIDDEDMDDEDVDDEDDIDDEDDEDYEDEDFDDEDLDVNVGMDDEYNDDFAEDAHIEDFDIADENE